MLTLDKIYHAAFVLKDVARKTDLIEAPKLSKDCQLYLKTENLQGRHCLLCGQPCAGRGAGGYPARHPQHRLYAGRRTPDEGGKHQKSGRGGLPCARHLRRSPR